MIHVCSLARLHETVSAARASHVVTLLKDISVPCPPGVDKSNHLVLRVDDIVDPMDGMTAPLSHHVDQLLDFVQKWDRRAPIVFHCYAGISRSTAAAFTTVCALNPKRDELKLAWELRKLSAIAQPNLRIVALADKALGRDGRMVRAVQAIGLGNGDFEGNPFRLDLNDQPE